MNRTNYCKCQSHFDVRCVCPPKSLSFVVCPQKINTAVWYLENDGLTEDEDWETTLRSILEEEIIKTRVYSDNDIEQIIEQIKENKKEYEDDSDYETESSISSEEYITEGEVDDFLIHRDEDEQYFKTEGCDYKINSDNFVEK